MNDDSIIHDLETIRDYLRWASSRFNEAECFYAHGTDNAWDDAAQLLSYAIHLPIDTPNVLDARLTLPERQRVLQLVQERIDTRKPVPYLTHQAWFAGLEFYVDERVLVPRSPIAQLIQQQFEPWIAEAPGKILDLCTGSACIAIASAIAFPQAQVDAVDIDQGALEVAKINVQRFELADQVHLKKSDLFTELKGERYDLIVTNPPYVSESEIAELPKEFQHEPKLGLWGQGKDGLDLVQKILQQAADHLTEQGVLICEVGFSEEDLMTRYPQIPFTWIEFEEGGQGVFLLTAKQCCEYQF